MQRLGTPPPCLSRKARHTGKLASLRHSQYLLSINQEHNIFAEPLGVARKREVTQCSKARLFPSRGLDRAPSGRRSESQQPDSEARPLSCASHAAPIRLSALPPPWRKVPTCDVPRLFICNLALFFMTRMPENQYDRKSFKLKTSATDKANGKKTPKMMYIQRTNTLASPRHRKTGNIRITHIWFFPLRIPCFIHILQ